MIKLKEAAGTGDKILKNWDCFKYSLRESEPWSDERTMYIFDVSFGNQSGHMSVVVKNGVITQDTRLKLDGFGKPLGAHNDTHNPTEGLYEVGKKMVETLK